MKLCRISDSLIVLVSYPLINIAVLICNALSNFGSMVLPGIWSFLSVTVLNNTLIMEMK